MASVFFVIGGGIGIRIKKTIRMKVLNAGTSSL